MNPHPSLLSFLAVLSVAFVGCAHNQTAEDPPPGLEFYAMGGDYMDVAPSAPASKDIAREGENAQSFRPSLVNPEFVAKVKAEGERFPGIPFPSDHTITDLQGRQISIRALGMAADNLKFVRQDTRQRFTVSINILSDQDRKKFNEYARFSETEAVYLINKKEEARRILEDIADLEFELASTDSTTMGRTLRREITALQKEFRAIEQEFIEAMRR